MIDPLDSHRTNILQQTYFNGCRLSTAAVYLSTAASYKIPMYTAKSLHIRSSIRTYKRKSGTLRAFGRARALRWRNTESSGQSQRDS